jgi:L-asparagine oxygenase
MVVFRSLYSYMKEMDITLTDEEAGSLLALASTVFASPSTDPDKFCEQVKKAATLVPSHILSVLTQFAESDSGFLLIKQIPITGIPDTPPNNTHYVGETTYVARIQAILVSVISDLIAYQAECKGHLFQDIVPTKTMAAKQTSQGSVELEIHTEQAFSKLRPDFLSLSCLRGDTEALTYILPVQKIIGNLTEDEQGLARQPLWTSEVDLSFKLEGQSFVEGDVRGPMAILQGSDLVFDQDLMSGTSAPSEALIQTIVDIYYRERLAHCLRPGQILILDNRKVVHGRSTYHPKYDGQDRFLVRCFGVRDLRRFEGTLDGRMVKGMYS